MQELFKALAKARKTFKSIAKDRVNPFHKSKYATLDSVLDAVMDSLTANGLVILQTTDVRDGRLTLITTLAHESGELFQSFYPLPELTDQQKMGAAITYGRRYSLCAILNVTADEDDDGNSVSGAPETRSQKTTNAPKTTNVTDMQKKHPSPGKVFYDTAKSTGYTDDAIKLLLAEQGFFDEQGQPSMKVIPANRLNHMKTIAEDPEQMSHYNNKAQSQAS